MQTPNLLPCPFCGGAARLGREEDYCGLYLCYVECTKCSCRLHDEVEGMFVADLTLKELADAWNHRISTSTTKKVEKLKYHDEEIEKELIEEHKNERNN